MEIEGTNDFIAISIGKFDGCPDSLGSHNFPGGEGKNSEFNQFVKTLERFVRIRSKS